MAIKTTHSPKQPQRRTLKSSSTTMSSTSAAAGVHTNQCRFFVLIIFGGLAALIGLTKIHNGSHGHHFTSNAQLTELMDMPSVARTTTTTTAATTENNNLRHLTSGNTTITTTQSIFDQIMSLARGRKQQNLPTSDEEDEIFDFNTTQPMNVVLFYADDWTMKVLGKFDSRIKTPNIDRLADNGILFANNCVTTSICWMSRATLATGTYVSQHQQLMPFIDQMFYSFNWTQTLYPLLKNNNYFTGLVGKWHGGMPGDKLNEAFHLRRFYYGFHYEDHNTSRQHITDMNRQHALEFLDQYVNEQSDKYKNFFLKVSFFATHAIDGHYPSYMPMNWSRSTYYPNSTFIEPPKTAAAEYNARLPPFLSGNSNEGRTRWKRRFEPDYFQDSIKDLYSMATEVDWAIGEVIQSLEEKGFMNNTMIIFTTDNGNLAGEHGLAEKWYPFEESLRVPLVIYDPRMPKKLHGTINHDWTLNVDLAPTILGAAKLEQSSFMQGRDISQLYLNRKKNTSPAWRKDFFYEFNTGKNFNASDHVWKDYIPASFALVSDEWKYVVWPQHDYEQLFHRSVDPYDEWDLLHKIETEKNSSFESIQSTDEIYKQMKTRYTYLKDKAQWGHRI